MNAIFHLACTTDPWRALPPEHGKPDTIARYYRRLTHAGLWERLLEALKENSPRHPLHEIAPLIFRACRRAIRMRGLKLIALIRQQMQSNQQALAILLSASEIPLYGADGQTTTKPPGRLFDSV